MWIRRIVLFLADLIWWYMMWYIHPNSKIFLVERYKQRWMYKTIVSLFPCSSITYIHNLRLERLCSMFLFHVPVLKVNHVAENICHKQICPFEEHFVLSSFWVEEEEPGKWCWFFLILFSTDGYRQSFDKYLSLKQFYFSHGNPLQQPSSTSSCVLHAFYIPSGHCNFLWVLNVSANNSGLMRPLVTSSLKHSMEWGLWDRSDHDCVCKELVEGYLWVLKACVSSQSLSICGGPLLGQYSYAGCPDLWWQDASQAGKINGTAWNILPWLDHAMEVYKKEQRVTSFGWKIHLLVVILACCSVMVNEDKHWSLDEFIFSGVICSATF